MDDFLREFHMRRREEAMGGHSAASVWRRFVGWLSEPGLAKWAYGAGVAYAAIALTLVLLPREGMDAPLPVQPAAHKVAAPVEDAPTSQLGELDLRPSSEGTAGEQEF